MIGQAKFWLAVVKVTESWFADDLTVYASTCENLEHVTAGFVNSVLPTGNLKVDLLHINMGELSTELEIVQDIRGSACYILNALPRLCFHNLIVDNLGLTLCVCMCVCVRLHVHVCILHRCGV